MATLIIHPDNEEQLTAVRAILHALKISFEEENTYNPEFVAEILKAEEDIKNGKGVSIRTEDLWK
ncbi:DUF2683 family protein [Mucilaginibacter arboris]|uniref:Uncharacterized protein n=1 Tax=Mucilaginibacter arboris TaxID=2682090 RepID=A0A7K1SSL5_9SPHI|nr:DUF2683 family protein [Mucilaginibacter arboris]MVN20234.1 hypothetical protein [Mucilaginibacter arboris]